MPKEQPQIAAFHVGGSAGDFLIVRAPWPSLLDRVLSLTRDSSTEEAAKTALAGLQ